jgi:hypothetical protein
MDRTLRRMMTQAQAKKMVMQTMMKTKARRTLKTLSKSWMPMKLMQMGNRTQRLRRRFRRR